MMKLLMYDQLYIVCCKKMTSTTFAIGQKFSTFAEVETKIQLVERKNYFTLHRTEGHTLATALKQKRISAERAINDALKYYELRYTCVQGGVNFKARGKGVRSTSTFQNDCPLLGPLNPAPSVRQSSVTESYISTLIL